MSVVEMQVLRALRDDARDAVNLIIGQPTYVQYDDDNRILGVHKGLSLLDQLTSAKRSGIERVGGHSSLRTLSPLCVAACDLYREIDTEWRMPGKTLAESFRALPIDSADTDILRKLIAALHSVSASIKALLDPPRRMYLAVACPVCGVRTVFRPDDSGEMVQRPALNVDGVLGCVCLACSSTWPPERLEFLANVLGCQPL